MNNKVLLAMSGGIDSSIAAIILKEQGYQIIGVTYRTYDSIKESCIAKETGCCSIESIMEAKNFANNLGIEHHIIDLRSIFKKTIIKNFINQYLKGCTPNPCVECNYKIKWGALIDFANKLNCTKIATGHYARIEKLNNNYVIKKGLDISKDQSYFLWQLTPQQIEKTLFPIGNFLKKDIKEIAKKYGFLNLYNKSESQEICFIPDNDYRNFIINNTNKKQKELIKPGNFILPNGKIIGQHKGYPFYTIGQRKGLNIAYTEPLYVAKIIPKTNTVIVAPRKDVEHNNCYIKKYYINPHYYNETLKNQQFTVKIRYNDKGNKANISINHKTNKINIKFIKNVFAITPGQSAVIYDDDIVIGGGIIC